MKIHTCIISYNRLHLTKQAVESYEKTVTLPHTMMVIDNASTDGSREWLERQMGDGRFPVLFCEENRYPGYACNRGWEQTPDDADFLQRADNDWIFLPGWCDEVEERFQDPNLGQLGLRTDEMDGYNKSNVAGDCVIRRRLWDDGLRWDERPWTEYPPGHSEDSYMSPTVLAYGYSWTRVKRPCIRAISDESPDDPYYIKSWADRRILASALRIHGLPSKEIKERVRKYQ